ncbi:hypothetical protein M885DRAFT_44776 [Pelagophyceae sp. CCMP2097]|nr:hypothetical protein M885DRAFT_44776 [Pelagophyceae sp. CCMP2097]
MQHPSGPTRRSANLPRERDCSRSVLLALSPARRRTCEDEVRHPRRSFDPLPPRRGRAAARTHGVRGVEVDVARMDDVLYELEVAGSGTFTISRALDRASTLSLRVCLTLIARHWSTRTPRSRALARGRGLAPSTTPFLSHRENIQGRRQTSHSAASRRSSAVYASDRRLRWPGLRTARRARTDGAPRAPPPAA